MRIDPTDLPVQLLGKYGGKNASNTGVLTWVELHAGRSKTAGRKVQQKSVGAEVEETTETEEREGAQLNG